jgi:hypothetical protein
MNKHWNDVLIEKLSSSKKRMIKFKFETPFGRMYWYFKKQSASSLSVRCVLFPNHESIEEISNF